MANKSWHPFLPMAFLIAIMTTVESCRKDKAPTLETVSGKINGIVWTAQHIYNYGTTSYSIDATQDGGNYQNSNLMLHFFSFANGTFETDNNDFSGSYYIFFTYGSTSAPYSFFTRPSSGSITISKAIENDFKTGYIITGTFSGILYNDSSGPDSVIISEGQFSNIFVEK
ncbi:MAG TPA: DUF5025 domain-containing protein [Chitinophagales bacterium]|nr:DUF5025 domain-containing protein [Chitinophagales bacterium]